MGFFFNVQRKAYKDEDLDASSPGIAGKKVVVKEGGTGGGGGRRGRTLIVKRMTEVMVGKIYLIMKTP